MDKETTYPGILTDRISEAMKRLRDSISSRLPKALSQSDETLV